jgi:Dyp-type peroxidase family
MASNRTGEPQLELNDIQGDILVGLQKDFEWFLFFSVADVAAFKKVLGQVLLPRISTAAKVLEREDAVRDHKARGHKDKLELIGINVAFSMDGLTKLKAPDLDKITDTAFKEGIAARSRGLNDPKQGVGSAATWKVGGSSTAADGVILITGPTAASVDAIQKELLAAAGKCLTVVFQERGMTRELDRGHEHFGFLDGVSQPSVRGQIDRVFPHKKFLQESQNPHDPGQGLPGSDLLWPGEFVFGYAAQDPSDPGKPGAPVSGGPEWMKNGSFMVFRRLNQLVPEFNEFLDSTATKLGMDAELLGARAVGRWKSGAPLITTPLQDDPILGGQKLLNNDFDFDVDAQGRRCPFASHIRKAYPRNDITPAAGPGSEHEQRDRSEANTESHRIMRRGIPFGESVTDDELNKGTTSIERGLMFVCYQTSIEDQFEFIIRNWVNNPEFAPLGGNPGFDPLLGQDAAHAPRTVQGLEVSYPTGQRGKPVTIPSDFIVPTGGGYFLVPSISAIQKLT